jgi:hypothetical protein
MFSRAFRSSLPFAVGWLVGGLIVALVRRNVVTLSDVWTVSLGAVAVIVVGTLAQFARLRHAEGPKNDPAA